MSFEKEWAQRKTDAGTRLGSASAGSGGGGAAGPVVRTGDPGAVGHAARRGRSRRGRAGGFLDHRLMVLGVCVAVGGFAGAVRGLADGADALRILAPAGAAILGTVLAAACVVGYARR
ncbi:hypothetical protein [Streptomyces eurocidicus]|uniref:Uncharacterized protein n=1 Tax=Streptomyces eurocidicus TaxID=66423 RepID=A0A7W8B9R7_STREU|nr:hypothetical protein [Streptomyces eurocidicus]MBB5119391.1 hypothetical protein [Streptomyces eurocidicus]MBF6053030.1 hypothetical protein [Streptomyces eurocidicus]